MAKTSIRLKFRVSTDNSKTKEGSLYFQIIHNRMPRQVHTHKHIFADEWDDEAGAILCSASKEDGRKRYLHSVQRAVISQEALLHLIVREKTSEGEPFTAADIVEEFGKRVPTSSSMFNYIERQVERLTTMRREGTARTYKSTLCSFRHFRNNIDLSFRDFNAHIVKEYEAWLKYRGVTRNTISFYMRTLRTAFNRAIGEGLAEMPFVSPFAKVFTGMDMTPKRALPMDSFSRIKHLDLSHSPAQDFARNIFLLSFYLRGMSFIDMAYLKKSNLRNGVLTYMRHKTGQQLKICWEKEMQEVLEAMPKSTNDYLFPILTRQDGTEWQQYQNKLTYLNRALKRIAKRLGVSATWTSYQSRHSWASAAQEKDIPLQIISSGMGHTSLATTQIYLASITCEKIDEANRIIISGI